MGIQGLLPVLKPIQKQKHLSEFAGQTLAVDAYVWLHRGVYACAVELATNRPTKKYVDYCMQRVRLLRHYKIQPFIVFDGGPLPAKQGTEKEREKRRSENLSRANALAAQGKESQAREFYIKCVDITPQMAYQVIKALKAEKVPYVVAPYEADAQMAYLERIGFVDGILTEDSDLLVFGCKNVHFKLDPVSATIISISRSDFGSPTLASESLSFIGWTDDQFRWMAMMSGCDYLPSIAGIGLKTAHALLRKHKSVERAIRFIRLEGKKDVPRGYFDAFNLAEKVFLHQRVYDPSQEKLVYLTDPVDPQGLTKEAELFIGRYLEPTLAKRIAEGQACPISLKDMEDINPNFNPKALNSLPLQDCNLNTPACNKRKGNEPAPRVGILSFFTPASKPTSTHESAKPISISKSEPKTITAGKRSGKRTLVEAMEEDLELKRKRMAIQIERVELSSSRFFSQKPDTSQIHGTPKAHKEGNEETGKENAPIIVDSDEVEEVLEQNIVDPVEQEDGYLSPSLSLSRDSTPELSSPVHPRTKTGAARMSEVLTLDALSSPVQTRVLLPPRRFGVLTQNIPTQDLDGRTEEREARVLVRGSTEPLHEEDGEKHNILGPDLRACFDDDEEDRHSDCSEVSGWEEDDSQALESFLPSPTASLTPRELAQNVPQRVDSYENLLDEEEETGQVRNASCERIALGWRQRFSFGSSSTPALQATPKGKLIQSRSFPIPLSQKRRPSPRKLSPSTCKSRKSDSLALSQMGRRFAERNDCGTAELPSDDSIEEIVHVAKGRLDSFRFSR